MSKGPGFEMGSSALIGVAVAIVATGTLYALQALWDKLNPKSGENHGR